MRTDKQRERLVDLNVVTSVLSSLKRFAGAPGCLPSGRFKCCAQFGCCCSKRTEGKAGK